MTTSSLILEPASELTTSQMEAAPAHTRPKRLLGLDVLRGIAIILVLPHHHVVPYQFAGHFRLLARKFEWMGWIGVDLFFILSGFLIGTLLFQEISRTGRLHIWRFLTRRAFKIWPGYFALVAFAAIRQWHSGEKATSVFSSFWPNLLSVQNYWQSPPLLGHTWSLAVEEHFYLLLPLLLSFIAAPRRISLFPGIAICVIAAVSLFRVFHALYNPIFAWETHYYPTHLRMDALFCGVLLAYLYVLKPAVFSKLCRPHMLWLILAIGCLYPLSRIGRDQLFGHTTEYTLVYLAWAAVLLAVMQSELHPNRLSRLVESPFGRALAWVGTYSYGIYLWHLFVNHYVGGWANHYFVASPSIHYLFSTSIYIIACILVGAVMTYAIEFPTLTLRERYFPRTRISTVSFAINPATN